MIYNNICQLVGRTPVLSLNRMSVNNTEILVKLESFNPGGSVKDRLALAMIEAAERDGLVNSETVIIEPTSGNTGIGLALVCAQRGYRLILTMPESMSVERRNLVKAYGADVVLTPAAEGMRGAINKADELASTIGNSFVPMQFKNIANPEIHRKTTAVEILEQTNGQLDAFVAGVGTGGTITGVSEILKSKLPGILCCAVEPSDSPVLSGGNPGPHKIQGIGAGFVPEVLNTGIYDEVIKVSADSAFETAQSLAKQEGILCGISSGANVFAALQVASRPEFKGKRILTVICDTGERYLSTPLFNQAGNDV